MNSSSWLLASGQKLEARSWRAAFLQLLLPSQNSGFVGLGFGLGNHALSLVQDGQAGIGQNVVGVEFGDSLCYYNGFIQAIEVLQGTGHAVHGFGKCRVGGQGLLVFSQSALLFALGNQIEGSVVVVFGFLVGVVGHEAEILTGLRGVFSLRSL